MRKPAKKVQIGLYSIGLKAYWDQFPELKNRLLYYGGFIKEKLSAHGDVHYFGMVDDERSGAAAGGWFNERDVDLIFVHSATYCTSASVLPVHQLCKAPAVILNLQPAAAMNYEKTGTGEWLANCGACPVPEIVNALERCEIKVHTLNGLLGMENPFPHAYADENTAGRTESIRVWREIFEYVKAAAVKRNLRGARFGFLGNYYAGMLDMYSDFTLLQKQFQIHIEPIEMCTLSQILDAVTAKETQQMRKTIESFFTMGETSSDPLAGIPDEARLEWSARVSCSLKKMADEYQLDALSYYYHGAGGNLYEKIGAGLIVGNSLLTADGIPCAGEGDIKTNIAMKICDLLRTGGSFTEIAAADYNQGTILLGHDGPFHVEISETRPILRGMKLYHGKQGSGISVEAKVKPGPVTLLGISQTAAGTLKMIISEGEAVKGQTLMIGNTQTHVKFNLPIDDYYSAWFKEAPAHHCAMSTGHNAGLFRKVADLLGIDSVLIN